MGHYQPGVCNIGSDEIARRRRGGHIGTAASAGLLGVLVAVNTPRWSRLFVAVPALVGASGYLQARAHFCTGFGSRGLYNFGPVGPTTQVTDAEDLAQDRAASKRINLQASAIALTAAAAAVALPRR